MMTEDEMYEEWLRKNKQFVNRYFREHFELNLQIEDNSLIIVEAKLDGEVIDSVCDRIV